MNTLIVEPNPAGHRFQAVANVAGVALADGDVTLLTAHGARDRIEFGEYIGAMPLAIDERFDGPEPTTELFADEIAAAAGRIGAGRIVIMDGDIALKRWWRVARSRLRGLRPRPKVIVFLTRYPARLELREAADLSYWKVRVAKGALLLLARLTGTVHRAAGFAARDDATVGWVVKRARDPAICLAHSRDRVALRAELGLPQNRRLVGVYGGVNARKNPQLCLDAVELAGDDVDLVCAGPFSDEVRAWVDALPPERRKRVHTDDGFLSNERLDKHLAASDVVALMMTLEGPSGIQGKAMAADVPVVTAGSKTRAIELAALGRGAAVDPTVAGMAEGIRTVLAGGSTVAPGKLDLPTGETFGRAVLG